MAESPCDHALHRSVRCFRKPACKLPVLTLTKRKRAECRYPPGQSARQYAPAAAVQDLRLAIRSLRAMPVTGVAIPSLALGIGASDRLMLVDSLVLNWQQIRNIANGREPD